ncbi:hypothetical protein HMPREF9398_0040 [Streptococcus sanguinis VMC66]|nr:hypothetical protein HMPREF9398_0040 [Streptococcus sanguinis VMC66]
MLVSKVEIKVFVTITPLLDNILLFLLNFFFAFECDIISKI